MDTPKDQKKLKIIGNSTRIKVMEIKGVPAKIDTGATISSIWASSIEITPDNKLQFCLFAPGNEFYTGEKIIVDEFKVRNVRNSTGHETIRYMVTLPTVIMGKRIRISYTLADRSRNDFPVLIGRRALLGKFLVDVSKLGVVYKERKINSELNDELATDPQKFHKKYMEKSTAKTTVRDYYYQHFDELSPDKKFHFATRIKNFFHSHDFDDFFATYIPSQDLSAVLADNDFTHVNKVEARRPYFEKYDQLYGIEAALFRVNHLLNEYNIDLRDQFVKFVPLDKLYKLTNDLMTDEGAILTLSTWAVNVICLTEVLFPRDKNVVRELAEKALKIEASSNESIDPLLLIYLYTHIILCDSNFYTRPVSEVDLARKMLDRCATIIEQNFDRLILDVRIEFLVCASMAGVDYPELRARISAECSQNLADNSYIIDRRRPDSYYTLNGAEHTNVLFIMSGLDNKGELN